MAVRGGGRGEETATSQDKSRRPSLQHNAEKKFAFPREMLDSIFIFYSSIVYYSTLDFKSLSYRHFRLAEMFDRHSHAGTSKCFALLWVTDVPLAEFSLLNLLMQFKLICSFGKKDLILTRESYLNWTIVGLIFFFRKCYRNYIFVENCRKSVCQLKAGILSLRRSLENNSTIFSHHFIELCKLRLGDETFGFLKFLSSNLIHTWKENRTSHTIFFFINLLFLSV